MLLPHWPDPAALYRVLTESAPDPILTIDETSTIVSVNPAAERVFGYAADEMLGQSLHLLIPERLRGGHDAGMGRYLASGQRRIPWQGVRMPIRTKSGVEIPVEIAFGEFVADGHRVFSGFLRDISAQVASEQVVRDANAALAEQNAQLAEQSLELELANQQLQEQTAELEMQAEALQATAAQLEAAAVEAEVARRTAEAERARAEGILEAMADAYVALDPAFRIVAVNAAMARSTGLAREALLGRDFWATFPGVVGTAFERHYRRAVTEGVDAHFTHDYSDGRLELVVEVDAYPATGGGVAVFWRDITARVRADAERERLLADTQAARAEAEAANRAKSEFLAVMSHELRTPLNAIGGYAELIELGIHGSVTEAQRIALGRIQASQRHLLGLIAGVLDYSRVEAGAVTYRLVAVPVAEAVAEAEVLVAPQLRVKGLGYAWSGAAPGLSVRADREKLQQILLNLLSNAVKFTHPRDGAPGRVDVSCTVEDGAKHGAVAGRVSIHVRDTGAGIAAEQLERVFEPFVQVDQRLTRPHEGVGLGLAISRDLARGMGGDLTAESTPGVGSTFTLTLPSA